VVSLPGELPRPSPIIHLFELLPSQTSWLLFSKKPIVAYPYLPLLLSTAMVLSLGLLTHTHPCLLTLHILMQWGRSTIKAYWLKTILSTSLERHSQVSNSSSIIILFQCSRSNLLTSFPHFSNLSATLLMFPFLGLDSYSKIWWSGLWSWQPWWLWQFTQFMCPSLVNQFAFFLGPPSSDPSTPPPSPLTTGSAGTLVILLLCKKWRLKLAAFALSSFPVLPTDVQTKVAQRGVFRRLF